MRRWRLACAGRFGSAAKHLGGDARGVTTIEYCLIAGLIAAVCVGVVSSLGTDIGAAFGSLASSIRGHH